LENVNISINSSFSMAEKRLLENVNISINSSFSMAEKRLLESERLFLLIIDF